jgi:hypothetical protein
MNAKAISVFEMLDISWKISSSPVTNLSFQYITTDNLTKTLSEVQVCLRQWMIAAYQRLLQKLPVT